MNKVQWDLSDLYNSTDVHELGHDLQKAKTRAQKLEEKYASRVHALNRNELLTLLGELESIEEKLQRALSFAYLNFATQTDNPSAWHLWQKSREDVSQIREKLDFFATEWGYVSEEQADKMLSGELLERFGHYLGSQRKFHNHRLSLSEEKILSRTRISREKAWQDLYEDMIGNMKVGIDNNALSQSMHKLFCPERSQRQLAFQDISTAIDKDLHVHSHILNSLVTNKKEIDRTRNYTDWLEERNLKDETKADLVRVLVDCVSSRYDIVQMYYQLKGRILGLEDLSVFDRYAPIPSLKYSEVPWSQARDNILASWRDIAPYLAEIADQFFEKPWIHACLKPGKLPGAFCHQTIPKAHPYIFLNFKGTFHDSLTLAHEIGHGIHQYLSRERGPLQSQPATPLAEIASIFSEMLMLSYLQNQAQSEQDRLFLYCQQIEQSIQTLFRQVSLHLFEDLVHSNVRKKGQLDSSTLNELWMSVQRDLFGQSLIHQDGYSSWWTLVPHFFHFPGYVHNYALSELLVLALINRLEEMGSSFIPLFQQLLCAGGSTTPEQLLKPFHIDLNDTSFIKEGLNFLDDLLAKAMTIQKRLQAETNNTTPTDT